MFHMLGRLALTSSFSRRSSPGFRMGPTRFGFCCCERGLLNVFTMSISIHGYSRFRAPPRLLPRLSQHPEPNRSLAMFRRTHMGPHSPKLEHYRSMVPSYL